MRTAPAWWPTCSGLMLRSSMMVRSSSEARWLLRESWLHSPCRSVSTSCVCCATVRCSSKVCSRGAGLKGRGVLPRSAAVPAIPVCARRRSWAVLLPRDRVSTSCTDCRDPRRAPLEPLPPAGCRCRPGWPPQAVDRRSVARNVAAAGSQLLLLWETALQSQRGSSRARPLAWDRGGGRLWCLPQGRAETTPCSARPTPRSRALGLCPGPTSGEPTRGMGFSVVSLWGGSSGTSMLPSQPVLRAAGFRAR